jgi:hypothetical protein
MAELYQGTVTLVFSDIEGSTHLSRTWASPRARSSQSTAGPPNHLSSRHVQWVWRSLSVDGLSLMTAAESESYVMPERQQYRRSGLCVGRRAG